LDAEFEHQATRRKLACERQFRWATPPSEIYASLVGDVDDAAERRIAATLSTDPNAPVCLTIDSNGGSPWAGQAIYQILRSHPGKVTCFVERRCFSAAVIAYLGGDIRVASGGAMFLVHGASVDIDPTNRPSAQAHRATAAELEKIDRQIIDVIACRAGRYPLWRLRQDMAGETYHSAHDARLLGLVTQVAANG
jgi:ATP-dependent protease ClpP protease subunit